MTRAKWRALLVPVLLAVFVAAYAATGQDAFRRKLLGVQISASVSSPGPRLLLAAGLVLVAFSFGRVYCSILCPAGMIQEIFHRIGGWLGIRRLRYSRSRTSLPLLLLVSGLVIAGTGWSLAVAGFLDPVGLFGRTVNSIAGSGPGLDARAWTLLLLGAALLAVPSLFKGRFFCDRLCPVGAMLRHASDSGGRKMTIVADKCVSCGQCEKVCQTGCADAAGKSIDPGRCVLCLDCRDACAFGAIAYRPIPGPEGRRLALASLASAAGGLFFAARPLGESLTGDRKAGHVLPPGSVSESRHALRCVGCQACVPACPVGIIRPAGDAGMRPVLDFDLGYCQYNCAACIQACPAGVLDPLTLEEKQRTRIAATSLDLRRCVVVANGTACGACAEVCPTHAVVMVDRGDGNPTVPDFRREHCIGCGACYHVCPAEPRAFIVAPLDRQEKSVGLRLSGRGSPETGTPPSDGEKYEIQEFPF